MRLLSLGVRKTLQLAARAASRLLYRFHVTDARQIPTQGAAVLVCNHVSFIDAVLLMAASPRPVRFIMAKPIFDTPVLGILFRLLKAIPIASAKDDPQAYAAAFQAAREALAEGELLCIFPEGAITHDGALQPFKGGVMKVLDGLPDIPVVPMALQGLWGSFFSRVEKGRAMVRPFRRGVFSRVGLVVGEPVKAGAVSPDLLRERVATLLSTAPRAAG